MVKLHTGDPVAPQGQPGDQRMGENREIRPLEVGRDVRAKSGLPQPVAHANIANRRAAVALHHPAVVAVKGRNPYGFGALDDRRGDAVGIG